MYFIRKEIIFTFKARKAEKQMAKVQLLSFAWKTRFSEKLPRGLEQRENFIFTLLTVRLYVVYSAKSNEK